MKLTPQPSDFPTIKAFFLGRSGTGKSGSTVPLAIEGPIQGCSVPGEGFELCVLDYDGKYRELAYAILDQMTESKQITRAQRDEALGRIDVVVCRENSGVFETLQGAGRTARTLPTLGVKGTATAWRTAQKQLQKWESVFTSKHILIVDSFTHAASVAANFWQEINGLLNQELLWQHFSGPQQLLGKYMTVLADLKCNVIICAHQTIQDIYKKTGEIDPETGKEREELIDSVMVPISIGRAGSVQLPNQFNHLLVANEEGSGRASHRYIHTQPFRGILTKSPFFRAKPRYPIETGWVEYFALRRGMALTTPAATV